MLYPRFITPHVLEALSDSPVVFITGARQTGKTTLVQQIARDEHPAIYRSLDDLTIRSAAQSDPHGFLKNIEGPSIIDEIQLAPELLPAMKLEIDENRQPGRFVIKGSANVLNLPRISE
jgi:predicted AAA+ superfamily ATPase